MNIYKRDTSLPFMESVSITAFMRYGPRKGAPRIPDLVEVSDMCFIESRAKISVRKDWQKCRR
ncbi:hypothetical protein Plhal304r1_c010g0038231 [Plasmopara halstedii]